MTTSVRAAFLGLAALLGAGIVVWNSLTLALSTQTPELALSLRPSLAPALVSFAKQGFAEPPTKDSANFIQVKAGLALGQSPVARDALGLVAMGHAQTGDSESARSIAKVSMINGNRDQLANLLLLSIAVEDGNADQIAARADIAMRAKIALDPAIGDGIGVELANPQVASKMVSMMAKDPPWRVPLLHHLGADPQFANASWALISGLDETSRPPSVDEVAPYFWLTARNLPTQVARAQWMQLFGRKIRSAQNAINDSGFDGNAGVPPFAWYLPVDDQISTRIGFDANGQSALLAEFGGEKPSLVTTQLLSLPSGTGQISFEAALGFGSTKQLLDMTLTCVPSNAPIAKLTVTLPEDRKAFGVSYSIPSGCEGQQLDFFAKRNFEQEPVLIILDSVSAASTGARK